MSNVSLHQHNSKQLDLSIQRVYVDFKTSSHHYTLLHLKKTYMWFFACTNSLCKGYQRPLEPSCISMPDLSHIKA